MSKLNTPEILEAMAKTYRERNLIYGDNWETHVDALRAIFPDGIVMKDFFETAMYSWFSIILGKMTRFANAKFRHQDSIHDIAVYAAMMESFLEKNSARPAEQNKKPSGSEYVLCYKGVPDEWKVKREDV